MVSKSDIVWFKTEFGVEITQAVVGTGFDVNMLAALASQETGYIWSTLRSNGLTTPQILELCVGDTLDQSGGRAAFPRTKAELLGAQNGDKMFAVARQGLVDMARYIQSYQRVVNNPDKFCHGFGMFQYDLQFYNEDPNYFLEKKFSQFSVTLGRAVRELKTAKTRAGLGDKTTLTDLEMAAVGIAYNTGRFNPDKGLKQGHFDGTQYYGESFYAHLQFAKGVSVPGEAAPAPVGVVAPPAPSLAYRVDIAEGSLRLRSSPEIPEGNSTANVVASLADNLPVTAVSGVPENGFLEIVVNSNGVKLRGYASATYLVKV